MVIEALVRGEVMTRAKVPDEDLELPGATWERAVQYREEVMRLQLLKLQQKLTAFYKPEIQVEYRLVFQSKLHLIDDTESTNIADGNGRLRINDGPATGDSPDAAARNGGPGG